MKNLPDKIGTENLDRNFMLNNFFRISFLYETIWKLTTGHATDDNMAHAHCILNTLGYQYTLRICNSY